MVSPELRNKATGRFVGFNGVVLSRFLILYESAMFVRAHRFFFMVLVNWVVGFEAGFIFDHGLGCGQVVQEWLECRLRGRCRGSAYYYPGKEVPHAAASNPTRQF